MEFALFPFMENRHLQLILAELGDSVAVVAATLESHGVAGVKNTVRHLNPIVRYVQTQLRIDDFGLDIMQRDGKPTLTLRLSLPHGAIQEIELPRPVREFIEAFNRGAYPHLELPQESM